MKVKMILPALTEATSPFWRPIKYSLFPPLGLATLAGYLDADAEVSIQDEHVERLDLTDTPDLVVIQVYITSATRAYGIADAYRRRGVHVALGGLHVTSLPEEAARHADTIFIGPGEDTWPRFLQDFRRGAPGRVYRSTVRTLAGLPPIRRDLIKRHLYLVPNSLVVSRGCPHVCDFCYKEAFFEGGRGFYHQTVDAALAEIERLPGRHLYFLDDHLFGDPRFASALFDGMRGMGRLWQAAGTVNAVLAPGLLERAVEAGLRSLFVGFETLSAANLVGHHKHQNLRRDYATAVRRLHDLGVMINGSFVFGMDDDDGTVFARTVDWAVEQGIETATFHILTPYPGTGLYQRMAAEGRLTSDDWDRYDTRHAVFRPARMTAAQLEHGYHWAYDEFYRWSSIVRGAAAHGDVVGAVRHAAYAAGWKKFEPLWDVVIRAKRTAMMLPALESILSGFGTRATRGTVGREGARPASRASLTGAGTPTSRACELRTVHRRAALAEGGQRRGAPRRMGDPFRETTKPMPHRDAAETAAEHLKRRVLLTILALSWMGSGLAWILVERRGLSSDVLRVVFGLNAVFHPAMAATVWRRLLPVQAVELSCLFFASILCGACMALRFYGGPTTANIALEPLYLWIPVIYVFAFTLPNRRLSLTIALAILALFVAISLPWLVRHVAEPEGNFTIQMHFVSGVLIAALYLFSSYLHNFQTAQLTVDELARLANTDELTKLANRRRMTEAIEYELVRYSRYGHPFSVIVLDLDHFKSINDRFGHRVGDDSLVALASRTTEALRDVDMLGRWGGEEFIVVLPETRFDETLRKASSLCQHVAATPLVGEHATTISCGVTSVIRGDTVETLLQRADVALYEAKRRGRNRAEGVRTTTDAQALVTS